MMELNTSAFHSFLKRTLGIPWSKQVSEPTNTMKSDLWQKCAKWYENRDDNEIIIPNRLRLYQKKGSTCDLEFEEYLELNHQIYLGCISSPPLSSEHQPYSTNCVTDMSISVLYTLFWIGSNNKYFRLCVQHTVLHYTFFFKTTL